MARVRGADPLRAGDRRQVPFFLTGRYILLRAISLALNLTIMLTIGGIILLVNLVLANFSKRALPSEAAALRLALAVEAIVVIIRAVVDIRRTYSFGGHWLLNFLSDILSKIFAQ